MLAITVLADDRITGEGATSYLRGCRGVLLLPADRRAEADVALMLTTEVGEETVRLMETLSAESTNPGMSIVLVTDRIREDQLIRAVQYGLRGVMWRQECGYQQVLETMRETAQGNAELPAPVQGWLIDRMRSIQRDVLAPLGLTPSGLEVREVEVLRLLAEGLDTVEIAQKLNYSERTIKNIVSAMTNRLGLRNRTHAVAFALRSGAL